jgi:hypothetical protein
VSHDEVVRPIATHIIESEFGRPSTSRGTSSFPQIRFVSLVESGTHILCASRMAGFSTSERVLSSRP